MYYIHKTVNKKYKLIDYSIFKMVKTLYVKYKLQFFKLS